MNFLFLNNSLQHWGAALALACGATAGLYFLRAMVLRRMRPEARRGGGRIGELVGAMLAATWLLFIFALGAWLGSLLLDLAAPQRLLVSRAAATALLLQLAIWGDTGLRAWRDQYGRSSAADDGARLASSVVLCFLTRLALWLIVFLMILDNLGFNITTLVASLGIGGIAVALAVQNILGDLFASLSIMLDKPFELGDFIIVGDVLGSVEHIGLKTTRLRGLGGEQVVFSNGDLLKSRIHNHKRMQTRRVAFILRVAYGTSDEKLQSVPQMVRAVVTARPDVDFERAHFFNYGEWSLDFEVVYHFRSPDYLLHMDAQQAILFELYRRFERAGIQFAHPLSIVRLDDADMAARLAAQGSAPSGNTMRH